MRSTGGDGFRLHGPPRENGSRENVSESNLERLGGRLYWICALGAGAAAARVWLTRFSKSEMHPCEAAGRGPTLRSISTASSILYQFRTSAGARPDLAERALI